MTLLGNFVRTREQEEKRNSWRSRSSMRSISGAASSLMSTLILVSHASFAPFVPNARIISFLSGHAIKISQQSHELFVGKQPTVGPDVSASSVVAPCGRY